MNCFAHPRAAAVGMCALCQRGVCADCISGSNPRLVCRACVERGGVIGYEYKSRAAIGAWPLVHVCAGMDPVSMRPRIAKGVIAIGNISVGGIAVGGVALGLVAVGGGSVGLALALGGAAIGLGLSIGGLAIGTVAIGGAAIGFMYAVGGGAFAPAIVDGATCDAAAREFILRWIGPSVLPPHCR
jgi:hypothetical protein